MGNFIPTLRNIGRKRLRDDSDDSDSFEELDKQLHTPRRKKFMSTTQYIYKTLFTEGQNSDVTIMALNKEWKLHKVYLCQSPYFSSMFCGSWKEANDNEIHIEIADPNITVDALKIVLGSLYQDEITVEPAHVVSVLGAAVLFQLDILIQQCCDIMKESINIQTVIYYCETAAQYGVENIRANCFDWLLRNLLSYIPEHPKRLCEISLPLMVQLISSPNLFVIQTEFSIYILLKTWVFLQENPSWEGKASDCILEAHKFFQSKEGQAPFLTQNQGLPYKEAFQALRLVHIINHHMDIEMLEMDNILPSDWLNPIYKSQWYNMLRVDQGVDKGPKSMEESEFNKSCLRCGRILPSDTQHMWRWTGYNFGLDLIVTYHGRMLRLKRNDRGYHEYITNAGTQTKRHIVFRFTIVSINEQRQLKYSVSSGIQSVSLSRNEETRVFMLDKDVTFPIILSANFVLISPPTATTSTISQNKIVNA